MAIKHFCDLCGKPAMKPSAGFETTRLGNTHNSFGYHLNVEFTKATEHYPKTTDGRSDICPACMIKGLQQIIAKLEKPSSQLPASDAPDTGAEGVAVTS